MTLYNITAKHKLTGLSQDMTFKSIKQAKHYNPDFIEFTIKGVAK